MATSNNERQQALREKRAAQGLTRKEYWLTENEKILMTSYLLKIRRELGSTVDPDEI